MGRRTQRTPPAQKDFRDFERIERAAQELIDAFRDQDPLLTVMALRLAAQKIYDARCRERELAE